MTTEREAERGDRDCDICGRAFESDAEIADHVRTEHGGLEGEPPPDDIVDDPTPGGAGRVQTE
jgi:hypothetical protein